MVPHERGVQSATEKHNFCGIFLLAIFSAAVLERFFAESNSFPVYTDFGFASRKEVM